MVANQTKKGATTPKGKKKTNAKPAQPETVEAAVDTPVKKKAAEKAPKANETTAKPNEKAQKANETTTKVEKPVPEKKETVTKATEEPTQKTTPTVDLRQEDGMQQFADFFKSSLDVDGKKTVELCSVIAERVRTYEGKKKEIRAQLREALDLAPNQFSRMEHIGDKASLFENMDKLPGSVLSLKLLVKIAEKDAELWDNIKAHVSDKNESSAIKYLAEVAKAGDQKKKHLLLVVRERGFGSFLNAPYQELGEHVYRTKPVLKSLTALFEKSLKTQFDSSDKSNFKARQKAITTFYSEKVHNAYVQFMRSLVTQGGLDATVIEDTKGDLERFAREYFEIEKDRLLEKEKRRVEKLEKKELKEAEKQAKKAEKLARKEAEKERKKAKKAEELLRITSKEDTAA